MGLLRKLLLISGIVGVVLIYHGAMDVKYGFDIKACGTRGWAPALVFGLCTCAVGVLVLVNPFDTPDKLFLAAGIGFLFDGITDLFTVFTVAHAKATYERLQGAAPVIELEPGAAETAPLDGNTAATPAIASPEEADVPAEEFGAEIADAADESSGEGGEGGDAGE